MGKYDDILCLPHHVSSTRQRMTMAERAAQFSPFAALTGYEGVIRETGRTTEQRADLSEDEKAMLDHKQQIILSALKQNRQPLVTVTYFQPDKKKDGGEYITFTGTVKTADQIANALVYTDGTKILFENILDISCENL